MTKTMQAAFLVECGKPMEFREVPIPVPPPGHLLVEMETCAPRTFAPHAGQRARSTARVRASSSLCSDPPQQLTGQRSSGS